MGTFAELSRLLLGDPDLTEVAAAELLELIRTPAVDALLERYTGRPEDVPAALWVRDQVWGAPEHRPTCELVIMAWMFGSLPTANGTDLRWAKRWFDGRFWKYAHAHAPGVSGGYFGHWSYPPED